MLVSFESAAVADGDYGVGWTVIFEAAEAAESLSSEVAKVHISARSARTFVNHAV
jgi:hypothetical protein